MSKTATTLGKTILAHILLLTSVILFGTYYVIGKDALEQMHIAVFTFFRCMISLIIMIPMAFVIDYKYECRPTTPEMPLVKRLFFKYVPTWQDCIYLAICGIAVIPCNMYAFSFGLTVTSAVISAIMQQFIPVFTCVLAIMLRYEKASILKFVGIIIAVVGSAGSIVADYYFAPSDGEHRGITISWWFVAGMVAYLFNCMCYAVFLNVQQSVLKRGMPAFTAITWCFIFGTIVTAIVALFFIPSVEYSKISGYAWFGLVYSATAGGVFSFSMQSYGNQHVQSTIVAIYSTTEPFISAICAWILAGEVISIYLIVGVVVVGFGVVLVAYCQYKEQVQAKKETKPENEPTAASEDAHELLDDSVTSPPQVEDIAASPQEETKESA